MEPNKFDPKREHDRVDFTGFDLGVKAILHSQIDIAETLHKILEELKKLSHR